MSNRSFMCNSVALSEVGGVSTKWPQPGNRFVSFVRANERASERSAIRLCYLEGFARLTSSSAAAAAAAAPRPLWCENASVFARVLCKTVMFFYCVEIFSHKT